ncbi:hypothetical protein [Streptococcus parauberis]|uniref:hypothetical protein n=1 Tax=Streptococcus parauberis TaxID=1348 RepID=UPI000CD2CA82|nr:hypothetical protein [Streptococcus parauberis]
MVFLVGQLGRTDKASITEHLDKSNDYNLLDWFVVLSSVGGMFYITTKTNFGGFGMFILGAVLGL